MAGLQPAPENRFANPFAVGIVAAPHSPRPKEPEIFTMAVDLFKIGLYLNALEVVFAIQWWAVAVPQLSFIPRIPPVSDLTWLTSVASSDGGKALLAWYGAVHFGNGLASILILKNEGGKAPKWYALSFGLAQLLIAVFCAIEPMKNATGVFPIGSLVHGAAGVALLSPIWRPLLDKATGAPVKTRSGRKSRTPKRYQ